MNDIAVGIRRAQTDGLIRRAMVVDCDVHHGNGTAAIFARDDSVYTLSIHQYNNYPAEKPPSDMDIHLPDRTGYLWLKTRSPEAIKIRTTDIALPQGREFRQAIEMLREEPRLGSRLARAAYDAGIETRDREWFGGEVEANSSGTMEEQWEKKYREEARTWQP